MHTIYHNILLCKIKELVMKISLLKFCHSFSLVVVPSKKYLNVICDLFPLLEWYLWLFLLEKFQPVDGQPQISLQLWVVAARLEHGSRSIYSTVFKQKTQPSNLFLQKSERFYYDFDSFFDFWVLNTLILSADFWWVIWLE